MGLFSKINDWAKSVLPTSNTKSVSDGGFSVSGNSVGFSNTGSLRYGLGVNHSAEIVTPYTVLQSTAACRALSIIANDIARLPLRLHKELPKGGYEIVKNHPIARLLLRPNKWQTQFEFWQNMTFNHQLRGNAYAVIIRKSGIPVELIPVLPECVSFLQNPKNGSYRYKVSHPIFADKSITVKNEDMIHLKNIGLGDGYHGISITQLNSEAFGLALATQKQAATMFSQGMQLSGILTTDYTLSDEAIPRIMESWKNSYSGSKNAHKIAILEEGLKFQQLTMNAEQAQLLESRAASNEDMARIFGVPPHKLGIMDKATYGNVEEQNLAYVDETLKAITVNFEQHLENKLIFSYERDELEIRFDYTDAVKGKFKDRMDAYAVAVNNGILTANEVRALEHRSPYDGGDTPRIPLNMGQNAPSPTPLNIEDASDINKESNEI